VSLLSSKGLIYGAALNRYGLVSFFNRAVRRKNRLTISACGVHHRESLLPETPTAEAALTAALSATKSNGDPDW
jgi:hypothetical protein